MLCAAFAILIAVMLASALWLGSKALFIKSELESAMTLVPVVKSDVIQDRPVDASDAVKKLTAHVSAARNAADDPLWTVASAIPGLGGNFAAVTEITRSAGDLTSLGIVPLVKALDGLQWESLVPGSPKTDLQPLRDASPTVASAAHAIRASVQRLNGIETGSLLPQVTQPLSLAKDQLSSIADALDGAADVARLAPPMLGDATPRTYLLVVQNNAESRASGGIPGALAEISFREGKMTLGAQSSASDIGVMSPPLVVEPEQRQIYSSRIGKFFQDVNLTPDFPTTAATARAMWERKTGNRVDGVISIDPVALSYILEATGPIAISNPDLLSLTNGSNLPTKLNADNVVRTLLSDAYANIEQPKNQDAYFAGVAQEIFGAINGGKGGAKSLVAGIVRATSEGRVLLWSASTQEQDVLAKYPVSGSISGSSISPAQFGIYFNDGTGAKMDYYVKRSVQLIEECEAHGYGRIRVRITSTNTAPTNAATALSSYVTGAGAFGVPAGSVQTNITAYGPVQSNIETALVAGEKTGFAANRHSSRPVGTLTIRLAPGQSQTVEFAFGKIVQHTKPVVAVTPTVQALKDVVLETKSATCAPPA
ncbi:DUF4012 domain-containing protein [Arthrobacter globiformis]|uniref:DUF4012 domain-containing protein n=1 Tax=Arthrobacter globiformis TaxID=1665 RepID=UPI001FE1602D|nr:DUF4012 domain-containing protein [Arthrobacter globiformis]